jgi:hypothetical protein
MVKPKPPTLLVLQHASWEGPHRILEACEGIDVHTVAPSAGDPLPAHAEVDGILAMGGPMNIEDKPGFVAYVAQKTAGRLDYGYLREVAGFEGARDLLRQAALQPNVGPAAKQALRAAANEIAGELFHQPPQP